MKEIDAAITRFLAGDAAELRRRQEQRTTILIWGVDAFPPGGPFPDAFTGGQEGPAAPADTGNVNRHRRRKAAAKSRH